MRGSRTLIGAVLLAVSVASAGMSDPELERFLASAPVVANVEVGKGVTGIRQLTLRDGDTELRASFKTVDELTGLRMAGTGLAELNQADRYHYDIAAYLLDRMLGLNMVPVTIYRELDGEPGSLTVWIEGAIDESERKSRELPPIGDKASMLVFDLLIFNEDRNTGNILYTLGDGRMHLIDHSRSFRTYTGRPRSLKNQDIEMPDDFRERLAAMEPDRIRTVLAPWLKEVQIRALLKRSEKLLAMGGPLPPA
ncbi:MAG: hypothetical protein IFK94_02720 [Acidobacteria bacterium]|uniref:PI3K/PI4K catalytic domain-containing protein n=1 Tax=Candidatus Polarisedimenticola svalbardensis TaxID=2886004 RepID=A0A8J6XZ48_9BACT|nr:hypothetical protein [Candidatus Polarisedimenticola svalbardensis]